MWDTVPSSSIIIYKLGATNITYYINQNVEYHILSQQEVITLTLLSF